MSETITMPLDLRGAAPLAAQQLVLSKAKSLQRGKSFQLLADHDLKDQIQLLASLGEDLTWAFKESGPSTWRVHVSKRQVETNNCCSGGACCG